MVGGARPNGRGRRRWRGRWLPRRPPPPTPMESYSGYRAIRSAAATGKRKPGAEKAPGPSVCLTISVYLGPAESVGPVWRLHRGDAQLRELNFGVPLQPQSILGAEP